MVLLKIRTPSVWCKLAKDKSLINILINFLYTPKTIDILKIFFDLFSIPWEIGKEEKSTESL